MPYTDQAPQIIKHIYSPLLYRSQMKGVK